MGTTATPNFRRVVQSQVTQWAHEKRRVIWAIAKVTFLEILRDKILYNVLVFAVLFMALSFLASNLSFVRPERILLSFGLSGLRISVCLISVFYCAQVIAREKDRRTVWVVLSRPISVLEFIWGKYLGVFLLVLLNGALLSALFLGLTGVLDTTGTLSWNGSLIFSLVFALMEAAFLGAIAVAISSFSTPSLAVVLSLAVYVIGHSLKFADVLLQTLSVAWLKPLGMVALQLFPRLHYFDLENRIVYALPVPTLQIFGTSAYALLGTTVFLWVASKLFSIRETGTRS